MRQLLDLYDNVMMYGTDKEDRTGTGTRSLFGYQMRFDLNDGFPATTTKKLAWKSMVGELLWFIEGSRDERRLAEITHGSRDSGKTIWTDNAQAPYWKPKAEFDGDLGRVYGVQWRHWRKSSSWDAKPVPWTIDSHGQKTWTGTITYPGVDYVDQLSLLVEGLKKDPNGRRHILTAWNPGELDLMALPPCHCFSQFMVIENKLSCQTYIRSNDLFLGAPFNIASYALFTHMLAQVCGYGVGELVYTIGDAHIYRNHFSQVEEQLSREPYPLPTLWINPDVKTITGFKIDDFRLENYQHHAPIKADMAV